MRKSKTLIAVIILLMSSTEILAQIPAFPGAEGFGANTSGGRGGEVMLVTNTNDSGPGSFRAACEASGPRIVVFRVGGTITLESTVKIKSPFITIAGQSAPGGGICLRTLNDKTPLSIQTNDVIMRYIRVRPGSGVTPEGSDTKDAMTIKSEDAHDIIIDHCSFTWGVDETVSTYSGDDEHVKNITFQWNIIADALDCNTHVEGCHSKGLLLQHADKVSMHHNLFANNGARNPMLLSGEMDMVNNVTYNWGGSVVKIEARYAPVYLNYVKNYLVPGPDSDLTENGIQVKDTEVNLYLEDNIAEHVRPDNSYPEDAIVNYRELGTEVDQRFNYPTITATSAQQAYNDVLDGVGASLPLLDRVDTDIINGVRNRTGRIIDYPSDVGGYPNLATGVAPEDSDSDGMPNDWEIAQGLNPNDASDASGDANNDGYTNIEEFLNGMFATHSAGTGRVETEAMDLTNYEVNPWDFSASNSEIIKTIDKNINANASYTFTGPTGAYDLTIRYLDEIDGASDFTLKVDGTTIGQWAADETTIAPDVWKSFTISNVQVTKNAKIEIDANANAGEYARLDYVEITPIQPQNDTGIYFVSTSGNDANPGTLNSPFATIEQAHTVAEAGDTIFLRGGNYAFASSGQRGLILSKNGTSQNPIRLWAYENETPELDFESLSHPFGVHGVVVIGNWWHLKGIEIKNVAEGANNSGAGIIIQGNNNLLELLDVHDIAGKAIQMFGSAANNTVKNCDAHHNYDQVNLGGNADGFQCFDVTGVNNKFTGCRAWFNSDDGWDLFDTESAVIIENCWAFLNGYIPDTRTKAGDGNGFKLGRNSTGPRHQAYFNLSAENDFRGFDFNNGSGGMDFYNNTSYDNGLVDFRIGESLDFNVQNNIGYLSNTNIQGSQGNNVSDNSWNLQVIVDDGDFISLDINELFSPRKANGDLPDVDYLHLKPESDLIDKGLDVGLAFEGSSPDLGAFESEVTAAPAPITAYEEAEDATIFSGTITDIHGGFSGAGFVDLVNEAGSYVEWTVEVTDAGYKELNFAFANGTDQNREMQVTVNGEVIAADLDFEGTGAWDTWSVQSVNVVLVEGNNTIRLTSVTVNGGPNLDYLDLIDLPEPIKIYEAENATIFSGTVVDIHEGFSGTGFVDLVNEFGSYVEWTVEVTDAGSKELNFAFANGTNQNREMELTVNGEVIATDLDFEGTGAWDTWDVQLIDAALEEGNNTIRLTSITTNGGPNLDYLELIDLPEPIKIHEAENATAFSGFAEDNHSGFSGTGFVNLVNEVGSSIEWTVEVSQSEFKGLSFVFANGTNQNRQMQVTVNGEVIATDLDFEGTGAWDIWDVRSINTSLQKGSNTIILTSITPNGGPNLDYLEIGPIQPSSNTNELYVATNGSDSNSGAVNSPFRTIEKAIETVESGGVIYLREGTYYPARQIKVETASGTEQKRTRIFGFPGESVIIDGSQFQEVAPNVLNNNIFVHSAAFWHYKDLEIRNSLNSAVLVNGNSADGNILENLNIHDNGNSGVGVYSGASNTLVKNCDSYRNYDPTNKGRDADGFAAKFEVGPGNKFLGCRAWDNADDGWDMWMAVNRVVIENCWAYKNGFDRWNVGSDFQGDGDGFKFGQGTGNHLIQNSMAWSNDLRGFNSNNNETEVLVYNCTGWSNNYLNFAFVFGSGNFVLKNNLSVDGNNDISGSVDDEFNSWNLGVTVNEDDFLSLSAAIAEGPRPADNELPTSDFLRLTSSSDLIDKGTNTVNIPFNGSAPDLGAFESDFTLFNNSVIEEPLTNFDIYPNPISGGRLHLRFSKTNGLNAATNGINSELNPTSEIAEQDNLIMEDVERIAIYDLQGRITKEVLKEELNTGNTDVSIDVSAINEGVYILFINYTKNATESSRFIIEK